MNPPCHITRAGDAPFVYQQPTRLASMSLSVATKMPGQSKAGYEGEDPEQHVMKN